MNFDYNDLLILDASLDELFSAIQSVPLNAVSSSNIKLNLDGISSVRKKLKAVNENPDPQFSLQELKMMYWAIFVLRDNTREYLDAISLSDPDREQSLDTQKRCNRLLREFSAVFSAQGIDIREMLHLTEN